MLYVWDILWDTILFQLGRIALLAFTLGRYPRGDAAKRHEDRIAGAGAVFLLILWCAIALLHHGQAAS